MSVNRWYGHPRGRYLRLCHCAAGLRQPACSELYYQRGVPWQALFSAKLAYATVGFTMLLPSTPQEAAAFRVFELARPTAETPYIKVGCSFSFFLHLLCVWNSCKAAAVADAYCRGGMQLTD